MRNEEELVLRVTQSSSPHYWYARCLRESLLPSRPSATKSMVSDLPSSRLARVEGRGDQEQPVVRRIGEARLRGVKTFAGVEIISIGSTDVRRASLLGRGIDTSRSATMPPADRKHKNSLIVAMTRSTAYLGRRSDEAADRRERDPRYLTRTWRARCQRARWLHDCAMVARRARRKVVIGGRWPHACRTRAAAQLGRCGLHPRRGAARKSWSATRQPRARA